MCYKVFTTAASYSAAKAQCLNLGSDSKLAAPKPAAVLTKLGELRAAVSADEKIWVGLDDRWVNYNFNFNHLIFHLQRHRRYLHLL
jgi:hypothetical protein